jgi:hypothetical protein
MKESEVHLGMVVRYRNPQGNWVDGYISSPPWRGDVMVIVTQHGQPWPSRVRLSSLHRHPSEGTTPPPDNPVEEMLQEAAAEGRDSFGLLPITHSGRKLPRRIPTRSDLRRLKTAANALRAAIREPCPEDRAEIIKDGIRAIQSTEDFGYNEINEFIQCAEAILWKCLKEECGEEM